MKRRSKGLALFRLWLWLLAPPLAYATETGELLGLDLRPNYVTQESPHFSVTTREALAPHLPMLIQKLELAYTHVSPWLHWEISRKIPVVMLDSHDDANGFGSMALRMGISLWIAPPDLGSTLGFSNDWIQTLVTHELTHALHTDTTLGYSATLAPFFGDLIKPNILLPRWMLEGLAVEAESRFGRGRGQSPYRREFLRAFRADPSFTTLDRIQGFNLSYPFADSPYVYGYELLHRAGEDSDPEFFGRFNHAGARMFPFLPDTVLKKASLGKIAHWQDLYDEWKKVEVESLPELRTPPLRAGFEPGVISFRTQGSGVQAWIQSGRFGAGKTLVLERSGERSTYRVEGLSDRIDLGAEILLGSGIRTPNESVHATDLFRVDLASGDLQWLTRGRHLSEPIVIEKAENELEIHAIETRNLSHIWVRLRAHRTSRTAAWILDSTEEVYVPPIYGQVGHLSRGASGALAAVLRIAGEPGDSLLSYRDGKVERWTPAVPHYFRHLAPGREGVLLSVARLDEGVETVAELDPRLGTWTKFCPADLGARAPSVRDENSVYASVLTREGLTLAELPCRSPTNAELPELRRQVTVSEPATVPPQADSSTKPTPHSAWSSLAPRAWGPLAWAGSGDFQVGGGALGFDTLYQHAYGAAILIHTPHKAFDFFTFTRHRLAGGLAPLTVGLFAQRSTPQVTLSNGEFSYIERLLSLQVSLAYPVALDPGTLELSSAFSREERSATLPLTSTEVGFVPEQRVTLEVQRKDTFSPIGFSGVQVREPQWRLGTEMRIDPGFQTRWKLGAGFAVPVRPIPPIRPITVMVAGGAHLAQGTAKVVAPTLGFRAFPSDSDRFDLKDLEVRGYPLLSQTGDMAAALSAELRIPVLPILRGIELAPVFFNAVLAFGYLEYATVGERGNPSFLTYPAYGGGLKLSTQLFLHFITTFGLEFHQGARADIGGTGEWKFTTTLQGITI